MDKLNELGFINMWGATPSINALFNENYLLKSEKLNILFSNSLDPRHLFHTIASMNSYFEKEKDKEKCTSEVNFYVFESFLENLSRLIVFVDLLFSNEFNNMEKVELFQEIYGNTLISEKASNYLHSCIKRISDLIYGKKTELNQAYFDFFDFSLLSFKEKDELNDTVNSYNNSFEFNIEKLREERLRFLYKQRYDVRLNLIDWDYQMKIKTFAEYLGKTIYNEFRMHGLAFGRDNVKYNKPNKTLSSYIPGRSVRYF